MIEPVSQIRDGRGTWEDHRLPLAEYRGTGGGLAISISACEDHQNSQDTTVSIFYLLLNSFWEEVIGGMLVDFRIK